MIGRGRRKIEIAPRIKSDRSLRAEPRKPGILSARRIQQSVQQVPAQSIHADVNDMTNLRRQRRHNQRGAQQKKQGPGRLPTETQYTGHSFILRHHHPACPTPKLAVSGNRPPHAALHVRPRPQLNRGGSGGGGGGGGGVIYRPSASDFTSSHGQRQLRGQGLDDAGMSGIDFLGFQGTAGITIGQRISQ